MNDSKLPNFKELEQKLSQLALKWHPSQVHGLLCGILNRESEDQKNWKFLIIKDEQINGLAHLLEVLYHTTSNQLIDLLCEFYLLLPEDSEPLQIRAEALSLWCQGYLTGVHRLKIEAKKNVSDEVKEAIRDLTEIAQMNHENIVPSEEDEVAYVELVEYVRVAVLSIYEEVQDSSHVNLSIAANEAVDRLH